MPIILLRPQADDFACVGASIPWTASVRLEATVAFNTDGCSDPAALRAALLAALDEHTGQIAGIDPPMQVEIGSAIDSVITIVGWTMDGNPAPE